MEPSTSSRFTAMSSEKSLAEDDTISVEVEKCNELDNNAVVSEEASEQEMFIPSSSVCPKTPDAKALNRIRDRYGKQYCSTPLTTPRLTPRLGLIAEEDRLSITISDVDSTKEEVTISEDSPKSKNSVFKVVLAATTLIFMMGFLCGFYLSSSKAEAGIELSDGDTPPSVEPELLDQSYTLDEVMKWAVGNVSDTRLIRNYRSFGNQLCITGSQCDLNLANHIAELWKTSGISDIIQESVQVVVSVPDIRKTSSLKMVDSSDGSIILQHHLYGHDTSESSEVEGSTVFDELVNETVTVAGVTTVEAAEITDPLQWPLSDFVPFSHSGNVQGELVYAHFGTLEDFNTLIKMKIDTKGKIALIKNGLNPIYNKIINAQEHGVVGLLLYDDPLVNENLPRIPSSFDVTGIMGDPFTPSLPANGVYQLLSDNTSLPKIPVHIIQSEVAHELLGNLAGKEAPESWQGGFNLTYHVGKKKKSKSIVELEIHNSQEVTLISNVIGTVKGKLYPDEIVLIGSHRTSFPDDIQAAESSVSMATELASVIGQLLQNGWQPERTIMLCSWAAHEYGFSGSVEWMEKHKNGLLQDVVAYVDIDAKPSLRNNIHVVSSPFLRNLVRKSAQKLGIRVNSQEELLTLDGDHAPFAHHLGIPSLSMSAVLPLDKHTGGPSGTVPSLSVATQFLAQLTMLLSSYDVLPLDLNTFVDEVVGYYRILETQYGDRLQQQGVSLEFLKESINKMSEVISSLEQPTKPTELQIMQVNRKFRKLQRIFIDENNSNFIRNMLLGRKSDYSTFPRLEELLDSPDFLIMQIKQHLAKLYLAFESATEVLSWKP
ncbi:aminopeptidase NAALADL1-like [Anneissia japonica]|uniref:aminopeptidase NAALADL1-like n=1 Tax=Anneissia japonica TaxID=1529436 RepID=UPI0014258C86|nr:aminopeptidase NAALADL1-like [Anneissia japonica]